MQTALVGAAIAATAAVFAAVMSWSAARRARQSSDRTHAWTRITWASALRPGDPGYDISRTVLRSIATLRWAAEDDRALADELARSVSDHSTDGQAGLRPDDRSDDQEDHS